MAFTMRTTKPSAGNKYYIRKADGGYSNAIKGSPTDSECGVLANCVGYAYGRFNEIGGYGCCKYLAPVNAENFMSYKGSCSIGQTPKVGACMVWQKGATLNGSDGAGHVAIVEKVISDTEVYTSESGYGASKPFWNQTRKKGSDGKWGCGSAYTFLGFIYNPATVNEAPAPATPSTSDNSKGYTGKFAVGDTVNYTGSVHYSSANASTGPACKGGKAKVTAVSAAGKHPYHLIAVSGEGSTVYGWVDEALISAVGTAAASPALKSLDEIAKEVINGKWGNGTDRVNKLTAAGYNASAVQTRVNELCGSKTTAPTAPAVYVPAVGDTVNYNGSVHYANANASAGPACKGGKATITAIYRLGQSKHPYHLKRVSGSGATVYGWVDAGTFTKL